MQAEPVWMRVQLAAPARPDDGQLALCPACHHVTVLFTPWLYALLTPDRMHFARVEFRLGATCSNPEGCEEAWWVT